MSESKFWFSVQDLCHLTPLDIIDGEGNVREERITGFDTEDGTIEVLVLDTNGNPISNPHKRGEPLKERIQIPAPLRFRRKKE